MRVVARLGEVETHGGSDRRASGLDDVQRRGVLGHERASHDAVVRVRLTAISPCRCGAILQFQEYLDVIGIVAHPDGEPTT